MSVSYLSSLPCLFILARNTLDFAFVPAKLLMFINTKTLTLKPILILSPYILNTQYLTIVKYTIVLLQCYRIFLLLLSKPTVNMGER